MKVPQKLNRINLFRSRRILAYFKNHTRFPLYLLLHFVSQKDAAAIEAKRKFTFIFENILKSNVFNLQKAESFFSDHQSGSGKVPKYWQKL